jgi:glycosyltransferase involved in cell wall biosynthesis/SAM-dependent methyltransferase
MTKVLIVYHAGATDNARAIFRALAQHCSVILSVAVPEAIAVNQVCNPIGWLRIDRENSDEGYRMIPLPLRNPSDYRKGFSSGPLRRIVRELQPNVIHVWDEPTSRCLYQTAWICMTASTDARVTFYGFNNLPISFRRRLEGKLFWRLIDGGAVASKEALDTLRRDGFPRNLPLERIFWGIATDVFRPMDRNSVDHKLNLECEPMIGYVGRLAPEKGLRVMQAAMRLLPDTLHCLIVGSGPLEAELKQWAHSIEDGSRVHLIGARAPAELPDYLNCLDALLVPSLTTPTWKEQFGRVIAEAMACGVPVIGSSSGAIPEVIDEAGVIVPENDTTALANAVRQVVFDRKTRARWSALALERAQQHLSTTVMASQLIDFYDRVRHRRGVALRHFLHPLRSLNSLARKTNRRMSHARLQCQFRKLRRGRVDRCWCGGDLLEFRWHPSYGICARCGCYVNRRPLLTEELQRFYSFDVFWHSWYRMKGGSTIEDRAEVYRQDGRLAYWLRLIERYAPGLGRVIEIGCSPGVLLSELQRRGHECIGVEPDQHTAEWIQRQLNVDVRTGFFPDVKLPQADLLLAFDVLEHVPNPEDFVNGLARLLNPGGVAIIQAPIDRYGDQPPFKDHFDVFDDTEHLHIFTERAVEELARRARLKILNCTERFRPIHEICILLKPSHAA